MHVCFRFHNAVTSVATSWPVWPCCTATQLKRYTSAELPIPHRRMADTAKPRLAMAGAAKHCEVRYTLRETDAQNSSQIGDIESTLMRVSLQYNISIFDVVYVIRLCCRLFIRY
jgi:hypothetical protein